MAKAKALVASLHGFADRLSCARLDRNSRDASSISSLGAFCIVDAAGPFQDDTLEFARAVIECGVHYVDLADARDFIMRFPSLHDHAQAHQVVAVAGASSTPGLSMAVLARITKGWQRVDHVEMSILPGGRAELGLSVVRAILSYAGKPIRSRASGEDRCDFGWGLLARRDVKGLGVRLQSIVETADLDLVARAHPRLRSIRFFASVEQSVMHLGLWALSGVVRLGLVQSLLPFSGVLHASARLFRALGTDRGGMVVEAEGVESDGARVCARWTLIAERGDGPNIPALPALSVVHQLLNGEHCKPGAYLCADVLDLKLIEEQFRRFAISTDVCVTALASMPLFARAHPAFLEMPACLQAVHSPSPVSKLEGEVDIERGANIFARLIARCVGFPVESGRRAARILIEQKGDGETWVRKFGDVRFKSSLTAGTGISEVIEQFGPLRFALDLQAGKEGFSLSVKRWSIWNVPLPTLLAPATSAHASDSGGRYHFDVEISWFAVGRLVRYRGAVTPITLAR